MPSIPVVTIGFNKRLPTLHNDTPLKGKRKFNFKNSSKRNFYQRKVEKNWLKTRSRLNSGGIPVINSRKKTVRYKIVEQCSLYALASH